jgi:hypothetical protein
MRLLLVVVFAIFISQSQAQQIINLVMVGDKGVTENIKEAKYFIVIKTYGDTLFERLEYKVGLPMMKLISYKDSMLTIKQGHYVEYSANGFISNEGNYSDDKKNGNWYIYDDSAHAISEYKYQDDVLITKIDLDSLHALNKHTVADPDEIEAKYNGGESLYTKQIQKQMKAAVDGNKVNKSGYVRVKFVVNTSGKMEGFYLTKSAEFSFDELALNIMKSIRNDWIPASDHGRLVRAYREQPISLDIQD